MNQIASERSERASATDLKFVWQPLTINGVVIPHRVVHSATTLLYAENNIISDRHIAYYRERAMGGSGLMITEQQAGHPISKGSFFAGCTAHDPRAIPQYARLADAVHEHGGVQFVQLYGTGVHDKGTMNIDEWHPLWAASRVPSPVHHELPLVMEQEHIDDLKQGFAQSAANVKIAGIDGIEVSAAHSYLLGQFLSPAYNRRTDSYGGSVRKRCQLILEIAEAIRSRVGPGYPFGLRISFDEFLGDAGITQDQAAEQLEIFATSGLFDFFNISGGAYQTLNWTVGPMTVPEGFMIPFGRRAKQIVGGRAKVFVAGRIRDIRMADEAIAAGSADMVVMMRMQLADAQFINKLRDGRESELIQCVGSNECVARAFDNREVVCLMNPITGRERKWGEGTLKPVSAKNVKRVLVVGGGPAGMKTAAVAAKRGHHVHLIEAAPELGGHLADLKRLPTREGWQLAIDNFETQMRNHNVKITLNLEATAEVVDQQRADVVVIATGAGWDRTGFSLSRAERDMIPGSQSDHVIDLGAAMRRAAADPKSLGRKVIILDESSLYEPLGLAEVLARAGVLVEVVSPELFIGSDTMRHLEMGHIFPRLRKAGVALTAQHFVDRIEGRDVAVYDIWGGGEAMRTEVDTIVCSIGRTPHDSLYRELVQILPDVRRVGDVLAPRKTPAVIYEGEEMGRAL